MDAWLTHYLLKVNCEGISSWISVRVGWVLSPYVAAAADGTMQVLGWVGGLGGHTAEAKFVLTVTAGIGMRRLAATKMTNHIRVTGFR